MLHGHGYKYYLMWRFIRERERGKEGEGEFLFIRKRLGEGGERRETGKWIFIVGAGLPHVPFTVWSMEVEVVAFFVCFSNGFSCSSDRIRSI